MNRSPRKKCRQRRRRLPRTHRLPRTFTSAELQRAYRDGVEDGLRQAGARALRVATSEEACPHSRHELLGLSVELAERGGDVELAAAARRMAEPGPVVLMSKGGTA